MRDFSAYRGVNSRMRRRMGAHRKPRCRFRGGMVSVACAIAVLGASCQSEPVFSAYNGSGQTLTIQIEGWDNPLASRNRTSGGPSIWPMREGDCRGTAVVALTEDGQEFARLDQPACQGDSWRIEADGARLTE